MTLTITRFALLPSSLKEAVRDMGGKVTNTEQWEDDEGTHGVEVEVHFESWSHELEESVDNIVAETNWEYDASWDREHNGVLFEWCRYS